LTRTSSRARFRSSSEPDGCRSGGPGPSRAGHVDHRHLPGADLGCVSAGPWRGAGVRRDWVSRASDKASSCRPGTEVRSMASRVRSRSPATADAPTFIFSASPFSRPRARSGLVRWSAGSHRRCRGVHDRKVLLDLVRGVPQRDTSSLVGRTLLFFNTVSNSSSGNPGLDVEPMPLLRSREGPSIPVGMKDRATASGGAYVTGALRGSGLFLGSLF